MSTKAHEQRIITFSVSSDMQTWIEAFLHDRQAAGVSPGTLKFYQDKFKNLLTFAQLRAVNEPGEIDALFIRNFLLWLQERGNNAGGVHQHYRALRAFVRWWALETEPVQWKNPFAKVKPPKLNPEPLEPVSLADIEKLLAACGDEKQGIRDRAIFLTLLDTGSRASELTALNVQDYNPVNGSLYIRHGKGDKFRVVFLGQTARRVMRRWLAERGTQAGPLFPSWQTGERLTYSGLREAVKRRAAAAGIEPPELHSFRRAFAINCLRCGMDVFSLQTLMGHADLQIVRRYLKQTESDLSAAHAAASPVDKLLNKRSRK